MVPEEKLKARLAALPGVLAVEITLMTPEQIARIGISGKAVMCAVAKKVADGQAPALHVKSGVYASEDLINDETFHDKLVSNVLQALDTYYPDRDTGE